MDPIIVSKGEPGTMYVLYEVSSPSQMEIVITCGTYIGRYTRDMSSYVPMLIPIDTPYPDSRYRVSLTCDDYTWETIFTTCPKRVYICPGLEMGDHDGVPVIGRADMYVWLLPSPPLYRTVSHEQAVAMYRGHYGEHKYPPTGTHIMVGNISHTLDLPDDWQDIVDTSGWEGLSYTYDSHRDKVAIAHMQVCHERGILLSGTLSIMGKRIHIHDNGAIPDGIDILLSPTPMNMLTHDTTHARYDIICRHPSLSGETTLYSDQDADGHHSQYTISSGMRTMGTRLLWWLLRLSCMGHRYFTTKGTYIVMDDTGIDMITPSLLM